jgi:hypothetical protein
MKQYLLLLLAVLGLLACVPTQSQAQVSISVNPGYSRGYYYQGQPYYYRHPYYHHYYHHYYHRNHWHD